MAEQRAAPYLFISYASADHDRVMPVVDALLRAGIPVWIDREGISGGENYAAEIADAIERCAAFALMTSAQSLASRNVKQELALGWRYERTYVPLLLEPVSIPKDVAYWLEAAQWIEVLEKAEGEWLPQVLEALQSLGIVAAVPEREEIRLAGREKELTLLGEKLAAAKGGQGGLVLIGGEAGIGKTALAEATLHEAGRQGFVILEGHCFDLAETPPYGPWIDLFARYEPPASSPRLPAAFAQRGAVGAVASQMALFVQVQDFLKAVASRRPIALLLDDLHWSDPASLDLLRFLARSVATLPLLVLVTYRSDELTRRHPHYALLPQLAREASAARIDLGHLDDTAVRAVVAERYELPDAKSDPLVAYLQARAEGNALFLGELLRTLEEEGVLRPTDDGWSLGDLTQSRVPALLRQVIDGRLARLGEEALAPLAVAAVIGQEIPFALWATIIAGDEETLLGIIEQATEARLVEAMADGTSIRFAHALIRETLYEGIVPIRRRIWHRRIGEEMASRPHADPDTVAYHFQQAGDPQAVPWLIAAGERAQDAYAWPTAADRFEAALARPETDDDSVRQRGWLLYRIARLRRLTNPRQGIAYLDEAARLAADAGDAALAAGALFSRGSCRVQSNDYARGLPDLAAGVDAIEALAPAVRARLNEHSDLGDFAFVRGSLVLQLAVSGRYAEAIAMGERFVATFPTPEEGNARWGSAYIDALAALWEAYVMLGRLDYGREMFTRARALYEAGGYYFHLGRTMLDHIRVVLISYETDRVAARHELAAEAARFWLRVGGVIADADDASFLASLPFLRLEGRWHELRTLAYTENDQSPGFIWASFERAPLAREQGNPDQAWAMIRELLPDGPRTALGSTWFNLSIPLLRVAAALACDMGDLAEARAWLEAHDRWLAWSGAVLWQSEGQALWAQYHRQAGEMDKAREHAERALAHATEPRQPLALIAAHRLLGELDTDAGKYDDAARHLDASLALADACQAPHERALTLLATAELRAAMGEHEAARTLIDAVKAICEPLGAKPTLVRAERLAARLT